MAIGDLVKKTWANGIDVANAANFQRFEDKIYELDQKLLVMQSAIMLNRSTTQSIPSAATPTKVLFNQQKFISGTKLTFDSDNYGVKVGSGVNYVMINTDLWLDVVNGTYSSVYVYKNTTLISYGIFPARISGQEGWRTQHMSGIFSVTENDLLSISVLFSGADAGNQVSGGYTNACNMMVRAVS